MKHNIVAAVLLGFSVFACKNTEIEPEYMISLDETSVSCEAGADELTVSLTCNGDWTLSTDDDDSWCEASAYKGSGDAEITFTVEPNPETDKRIIWYEFRCEDKTVDLRISQDGHVFSVSADPKELTFSAEDNTAKEVTVTSSDDWTLEVKADWCTPSRTSGKNGDMVSFTVKDYSETEKERTTTAVFSCGDKTFELEITQNAKGNFISVEPKELVFSALGESYQNVTVTSSADWTLEVKDEWCTPTITSGKNGDKVYFTVKNYSETEKERTTTVVFTCGDTTTELEITQGAKVYSISVEPKELVFSADDKNSKEVAVTVSGNDWWSVEVDDDWCIPSFNTSRGTKKISFKVDQYYDTKKDRSAIITFTCGNKTTELTIIQKAKVYSISFDPEELIFTGDDISKDVAVTSSDKWTLEVEDNWCTPSVSSGKNGDIVTFTVNEFTDDAESSRTTFAVFSCGNIKKELEITQEAKIYSISVDKDEVIFDKNGESITSVTVTSSAEWTLTINDTWCTPSITSGKNGDIVSFSIDEYVTAGREATATFKCGNKTVAIRIIQENTYVVSLNTNEISIGYTGQEISVLMTASSGWRISDFPDWITKQWGTTGFEHSNEPLEFRIAPNYGREERTAILIITCGDKKEELKITQGISPDPLVYIESDALLSVLVDPEVGIDKNGDGYISEPEAASVTDLTVEMVNGDYSNYTRYYKFDAFTSLRSLTIGGNLLKPQIFDLAGHPTLTSVYVLSDTRAGCLNLQDCKALTTVYISRNVKFDTPAVNTKGIILSGCTSLTSLTIDGSQDSWHYGISNLDISGCSSLEELWCEANQIVTLNASGCLSMKILSCSNNSIQTLSISGCTALEILQCSGNNLTSLDVSTCNNLQQLLCDDNQLSSLDVSKNTDLQMMHIDNNPLKKLTINSNHNISNIDSIISKYDDIIEYVD